MKFPLVSGFRVYFYSRISNVTYLIDAVTCIAIEIIIENVNIATFFSQNTGEQKGIVFCSEHYIFSHDDFFSVQDLHETITFPPTF